MFGLETCGTEATGGLIGLKQGDGTVADYSIDFRTRASQSKWNNSALCDAFLHGLADYIKDELVSHDTPTTLDGVIELATRIDLRIQTRRREKRQGGAHRPLPSRSRGVPLQPTLPPLQFCRQGTLSLCSWDAPPSPERRRSIAVRPTSASTVEQQGTSSLDVQQKPGAHQ